MKKVLLIDVFNLFIRCFTTVKTLNENGEHIGAISGSLISLYSFCKKLEPDFIFLCYEGKDSGKKRRKSFHEYKSGRKSPHNISNIENIDFAESFWKQLSLFQDLISMLPVCVLSIDYLEADDVISYLYHELPSDFKKIIVSTDQDFYQLIDENSSVFNPQKSILIDENYIKEKYHVLSQNWLIVKSFLGDKSDNVGKIKGIGIKKINKFFPELENKKFDDLKDFFNTYSLTNDKQIIKCLNNDNRKIVQNNYNIMNLRDMEKIINLRSSTKIRNLVLKWNPETDFTNLKLMMQKNMIELPIAFSTFSFMFRRVDYESKKFIEHVRKIWN